MTGPSPEWDRGMLAGSSERSAMPPEARRSIGHAIRHLFVLPCPPGGVCERCRTHESWLPCCFSRLPPLCEETA